MILLDTHVVAWLAFDQKQLSASARAAIDDARRKGEGLAIVNITLFELAVLERKGRIRLNISVETFVREVENRFTVLPMTASACTRALDLPANYPKDPVDRIIGATALVEGMPLVTADREIRRSKIIRAIW